MSQEISIRLLNVSKTFHVKKGQFNTIRDLVLQAFSANFKTQHVKALQEVSFEIKKGETFGIIGGNGSGKSTLIHLIMGSMRPDMGSIIETNGQIMRLALGIGMDPNLSARDNIYVTGSILGLSFKEIGIIFHEILEFADLIEFVDVPIKNYSKGMKARLNFSIAMHANADIFLLDEFFGGVGDKDFRKKSNEAFKKQILEGKTIIIVSHNMKIIKKFCSRVLWLDKGLPVMIGNPEEVINTYETSFNRNQAKKRLEI